MSTDLADKEVEPVDVAWQNLDIYLESVTNMADLALNRHRHMASSEQLQTLLGEVQFSLDKAVKALANYKKSRSS